ncbi:MAG: hypothetical protein AAFX10_03830 [Pseudomonadota bacterium]
MGDDSVEEEFVGSLPEIDDLSEREGPPASIDGFSKESESAAPPPSPAPPQKSRLLLAGFTLVGTVASALFAMYIGGYRTWSISPEEPVFAIPFANDSGSINFCYVSGTEPSVLVAGLDGHATTVSPAVVSIDRSWWIFGCQYVVTLDGQRRISVSFSDPGSSGWGVFRKE